MVENGDTSAGQISKSLFKIFLLRLLEIFVDYWEENPVGGFALRLGLNKTQALKTNEILREKNKALNALNTTMWQPISPAYWTSLNKLQQNIELWYP